MNRRQIVTQNLTHCVQRLDETLRPWGFEFTRLDVELSHTGPFSSGYYKRDQTQIGLSCRDTIDNIFYEHTFVTENSGSREIERYSIGHETLMQGLGKIDVCRLISSMDLTDPIRARDGGDRIDALSFDLSNYGASVLSEPCEEFFDIVRRGFRSYSVE